jgi:hypothetical protein
MSTESVTSPSKRQFELLQTIEKQQEIDKNKIDELQSTVDKLTKQIEQLTQTIFTQSEVVKQHESHIKRLESSLTITQDYVIDIRNKVQSTLPVQNTPVPSQSTTSVPMTSQSTTYIPKTQQTTLSVPMTPQSTTSVPMTPRRTTLTFLYPYRRYLSLSLYSIHFCNMKNPQMKKDNETLAISIVNTRYQKQIKHLFKMLYSLIGVELNFANVQETHELFETRIHDIMSQPSSKLKGYTIDSLMSHVTNQLQATELFENLLRVRPFD